MAVYGIGAYYDIGDVSSDFVLHNIIATGWDQTNAPELHRYITSIKAGDIVYIKAAYGGGKEITIKAIGIVKDYNIVPDSHPSQLVSIGRNVKWISKEWFTIPRPQEKNNVRSNTIYEEFHPDVLAEIISRIN